LLKVFYISQILEAIYSSPEERIGKTLVNRIKTLINMNDKTYWKIKKIFLGFYDLRSKFVHWDYHINNPILFDNFLDDKDWISKIWDDIRKKDINVIYAIIFASLQKIIDQWLTKIEFEEILVK